jgi:hypothetical protein
MSLVVLRLGHQGALCFQFAVLQAQEGVETPGFLGRLGVLIPTSRIADVAQECAPPFLQGPPRLTLPPSPTQPQAENTASGLVLTLWSAKLLRSPFFPI